MPDPIEGPDGARPVNPTDETAQRPAAPPHIDPFPDSGISGPLKFASEIFEPMKELFKQIGGLIAKLFSGRFRKAPETAATRPVERAATRPVERAATRPAGGMASGEQNTQVLEPHTMRAVAGKPSANMAGPELATWLAKNRNIDDIQTLAAIRKMNSRVVEAFFGLTGELATARNKKNRREELLILRDLASLLGDSSHMADLLSHQMKNFMRNGDEKTATSRLPQLRALNDARTFELPNLIVGGSLRYEDWTDGVFDLLCRLSRDDVTGPRG